jgi:hypothetical protein
MTDPDRLRVRQRPLADQERADLERQARESERFLLADWTRAIRRWTLIGTAVAAILGALAWATFARDLVRTKSIVASVAGALVFVASAGWDLRQNRGSLRRLRASWERAIKEAAAKPVVEIEVDPLRAWGGAETGWMFDVGGRRALYADWDLPLGGPTEKIVASVSPAGGVWFDQTGEELDAEPFPYSWEDVRDEHPLLEKTGPATFRLDADPGASFRDFLEPQWLVEPSGAARAD